MIVSSTLSWRIVVRYTGRPVLAHVLMATVIVIAEHQLGAKWLSVPALPVSVLAAALGILLAFRNNNAYDRWWEARTLWGALVNSSRSFARQVITFLPTPDAAESSDAPDAAISTSPLLRTAVEEAMGTAGMSARSVSTDGAVRDLFGKAREASSPERLRSILATLENKETALDKERDARVTLEKETALDKERDARVTLEGVIDDMHELVYAQIGFVNALRCHLRRQDPIEQIAPFFRPAVLDGLRAQQNVPTAILVWMGTRLRRVYGHNPGPEAVFRLMTLDGTLTDLTNILGACERIKNTPIPRQYDILPRVMVRVYLAIMPLAVVAELGLLTPFVTAIIAFLFIAMDAVGRNVEAPFENDVSDTPMTALCRTIEINLRQMVGETSLPPPVQPLNGILY